MLQTVATHTPRLMSRAADGALAKLLRENAVAGRIVVWCTEPSYKHGGAHMPASHIIPATLKAYREYCECASNVRLVLNPQREDFESATDSDRIALEMRSIHRAPRASECTG